MEVESRADGKTKSNGFSTPPPVLQVKDQPSKLNRRFGMQNFPPLVPAAAISAAAISLPMLVGRKRRRSTDRNASDHLWRMLDDEEDSFVKHFTMENEREMRQKKIAASRCRQLSVEENSRADRLAHLHLLLCQGYESRTLNMILLDGSTR